MWPDFQSAARAFRHHGWDATEFGEAIWRFRRHGVAPMRRVVLTAGVHGDETTPVELLARRLAAWADAADTLAVELCVALGNLDAMKAGKRYLERDMNRMFGAATTPAGREADRATLLRRSIATMLDEYRCPTWHLDLHTTIRPSLKPKFAIVPAEQPDPALLCWLQAAEMDAVVLNPGPHATLSACTARLGAASCTVELGTVAAFGTNDLDRFAAFDRALDHWVRSGSVPRPPLPTGAMQVYRVTQEILRHSDRFELLLPESAPNFTPLQVGQLVARDRLDIVHARYPGECVIFPNPKVALGLRAGLLVAPVPALPD